MHGGTRLPTALVVLAAAAALAGCVSPKVKEHLAAARVELDEVSQKIRALPTLVATQDAEAWKQLEAKIQARPAEFKSELELWLKTTQESRRQPIDQLHARLTADVGGARAGLEASTKALVDKQAKAHQGQLGEIRSEIAGTRAWLLAAAQQAATQQSARHEAGLKRLQGSLAAVRERLDAAAKKQADAARAERLAKVAEARRTLTRAVTMLESQAEQIGRNAAQVAGAAKAATTP